MQYREAYSEKSKTCLKLQKDPDKNVCKEEMQKGDNLKMVIVLVFVFVFNFLFSFENVFCSLHLQNTT